MALGQYEFATKNLHIKAREAFPVVGDDVGVYVFHVYYKEALNALGIEWSKNRQKIAKRFGFAYFQGLSSAIKMEAWSNHNALPFGRWFCWSVLCYLLKNAIAGVDCSVNDVMSFLLKFYAFFV